MSPVLTAVASDDGGEGGGGDWGADLHREVMAYLADLDGTLLDDAEQPNEEVGTLSGWPYDGCPDCVVREVLTYAVPKVMVAALQDVRDQVSKMIDRLTTAIASDLAARDGDQG